MDKFLNWAQPVITVVSLTFGGGVLYGDVQELKQNAEKGEVLQEHVNTLETQLRVAEETQRQTIKTLDKVTDAVVRLNTSVAKLEARLDR